jgi:hypothetical protein
MTRGCGRTGHEALRSVRLFEVLAAAECRRYFLGQAISQLGAALGAARARDPQPCTCFLRL